LKLVAENPNGKRTDLYSSPVKLQGKEQGQNFVFNFVFAIENQGLYWFDVVFDEDVLTRIPLTVVQEPAPTPTSS